MSLCLRIYALEIRLKVRVCRHLGLDFLPRVCKTHDLSERIIFTGLQRELDSPENAGLRLNWDILASFSQQQLNSMRA